MLCSYSLLQQTAKILPPPPPPLPPLPLRRFLLFRSLTTRQNSPRTCSCAAQRSNEPLLPLLSSSLSFLCLTQSQHNRWRKKKKKRIDNATQTNNNSNKHRNNSHTRRLLLPHPPALATTLTRTHR